MENVKYPSGEIVWAGYYNKSDQLLFIVTSKASRDYYNLYEYVDGKFNKIGRDKDPSVLVRKHGVRERMN